jgi:hypothetical protein
VNTTTYQVRPAGSRYEGAVLSAVTVTLLATLALYVETRGRNEDVQEIYDWQVSSFNTLTGADQAIYNSLYSVMEEIPYIYDDVNLFNAPGELFRWPSLQDFQDYLLPPFFMDTSWEQNGSLQWTLFEPAPEGEMQGSAMYLGTDGQLPEQGSFLLVISHIHAGFTNSNAIVIWWTEANHAEMPGNGVRDSLILRGWKEVVPYSGSEEVRRIFGE